MNDERKYQFLNHRAIAIISQWLKTTGAIAGYKSNPEERIGFIANGKKLKKSQVSSNGGRLCEERNTHVA